MPPSAAANPQRFFRRIGVFRATLVFSFLLHLSAVTVVRIVIWLPAEELPYYDMRIVPTAARQASATTSGAQLRGPSLARVLEATRGDANAPAAPPAIRLPQLETSELARLRARPQSLESPSLYRQFNQERLTDSWAAFGEGVRSIRETIARFTGGDALDEDTTFEPAKGYTARLTWDDPDTARELLFSPPLKPLWNVERDALRAPLEFVLDVDPSGRVVNVWSPTVGHEDLTQSIQIALLRYRFQPAAVDDASTGLATLVIQRAESGP